MRYISFIIIFILIFSSTVYSAEDVYNVGNLEISGEDLSTIKIKGKQKKIDKFEISEDRKRISRKLLNLGDSPLIIKGQKNSMAEIKASIGTYTTVNIDALIANFDSNLLDFSYKSSDGYRAKTDFLDSSVKFQTLNNKYNMFNGNLTATANYKRENMPGAETFETNFLERKILGVGVNGIFTSEEFKNQKIDFSVNINNLKGESKNLLINDNCDMRNLEINYEFIPETYKNIVTGINLFTTSMSLNGGNDKSYSDIGFFLKGNREFNKNNLLGVNIGLKKISSLNVEPEIDFTLRRKLSDNSNIKFSIGRDSKLFSFSSMLDNNLGYVNLRDGLGNNIFNSIDYPIRISNYMKLDYFTNFLNGNFNVYINLEDVDDDFSYISRNIKDNTIDLIATGDDTKVRGIGFTYMMNISEKYKLTLNGEKISEEVRGNQVPFKLEGKMSLKLDYMDKNNRAYFTISGVDGHYVNYGGSKIGGHAKCDLGYTKTITDDISVGMDMDNIFNTKFYKKAGMVERGRLTSAKIKYKF